MLRPLHDLAVRESLHLGLLWGSVAAAACVAVAVLYHKLLHRSGGLPVAGLATVAGTYVAARLSVNPLAESEALAVGLVALAAAGAIGNTLRAHLALRIVLCVPGALAVSATFEAHGHSFVQPFLLLFVVLAGGAASKWGEWRAASECGPALLLITALGVYVCVPETEHAAILVGAALPIALTGWPWRCTTIGAGGAAAYVGLIAWLAGTEGSPRPGAVVGAAACIGVLPLVPALRRTSVRLGNAGSARVAMPVGIIVIHSGVVILCSRVAGLRVSAWSSGLICGVAVAGAIVALRWSMPRPAPADPSGELS